MSQDVSNRLLELRNWYVASIQEAGRKYGFDPAILAQQIYLALSATEAKPLVEDLDYRPEKKNAQTPIADVRGDRPMVPPSGRPNLTGDGSIGN